MIETDSAWVRFYHQCRSPSLASRCSRPFEQNPSGASAEPTWLDKQLGKLGHLAPQIDLDDAGYMAIDLGDLDVIGAHLCRHECEFVPTRLHESLLVAPYRFGAKAESG